MVSGCLLFVIYRSLKLVRIFQIRTCILVESEYFLREMWIRKGSVFLAGLKAAWRSFRKPLALPGQETGTLTLLLNSLM